MPRDEGPRSGDTAVDAAASTVPMTPLTQPPATTRREPPADALTTGGSRRAATSPTDRQRALAQREEEAGHRRRLLRAFAVGLGAWHLFILTDLLRWGLGTLEDPRTMILARVATAWPVVLAYVWLTRARDASIRTLRAIELFGFTVAGAGVGLFAVVDGHLDSVHVPGTALVLLAHAVTLGSAWRHAIGPLLATTLMVPAVLGLAAAFEPELARQWADAATRTRFFESYSLVVGGMALALFGGHAMWSLRAQLSQARSIGRYELRRRLAAGGMGEVWSARHVGLDRDVAVKLIQPRVGADPDAVARFEREVKTLTGLTHPYVVRVFDYGVTEDGILYYAMELLEGADLAQLVEDEGAIDPERAVRLVRQAAEALAEAHAAGVVHRDVKPQNLLLVTSDVSREFVKLIDFGIARTGFGEEQLTATGMIIGTPGYIAPEVITGQPATPAADIYALGGVLYYLLAGAPPLSADSAQALALAHLTREPPAPSERLGRPLPPRIEAVVMRCLAKDPDARFRDASELAATLRAIEGIAGPPATSR